MGEEIREEVKVILKEELTKLEAQNILQDLLLETLREAKIEGAAAGQMAEKIKSISLNSEINKQYTEKVAALLAE